MSMEQRDAASNQLEKQSTLQQGTRTALTTSNGAPVDTLTASMTAGERGPILLQDFNLIDHLSKFDRERIPERVVHAKGAGAFGYFIVTTPFARSVCKAKMFDTVGKRTPVAVRFSTVGGESGSADTARDPRGFAVKFYTEEGNWDLVGNNTPKRNPATHLHDPDMFWDFIGLRPETTHQVSFLFSDRGTPNGYRFMNGYGSHTFKNVNENQNAVYVKYHFKTDQGIANLSSAEAARLASEDPDYATRDLYNAIAEGNFPSWTLHMQVMTFEQAATVSFNPFDLTKVWPHKDFPLHEVGRLVLDRNPENYFAEVEQLAFAPAHLIPGVEPSPDKMLQARLFSYPDTHRHRLGVNYQSIPVNMPRNAVINYQRDGSMMVQSNGGGAPNYFPNSFLGPTPNADGIWHSDSVSGDVVRRETGDEDNYTQCGEFFRNVLDADARQRLADNIAGHISRAQEFIRERAIANFAAVDVNYGRMIRDKVKVIQTGQRKGAKCITASPLSPPRTIPAPGSCPYGFSSKL